MLNKVLKLRSLVLLTVFFSPLIVAGGSSSVAEFLKPQFEKEIGNIKKYKEGSMEGVFLIKVFDHLIPIPNRYVLIAGETRQHEFNSFGDIVGFIRVGVYSSNEKEKNQHEELDFYDHELDVKIYEYKGAEASGNQIVISDGKEYLAILDQNPELWKEMIKAARPL